ncbi:BZ3500_MvSof-1268-A1-R1_Chr8-1g09811 [Microbotryum saponariae]|uniref:BZ3500_MvSof-1268-A1-R1_Chr8-1g09811 protein n=1 Tax=Microbotryum saponariae TaxID=289078 RepID=A0A2X0NQJ3_9BASI|nr:BZ3500_MvSof-1268-A1-R1_Chr8-1g09811 [Microbotryum saponariae]SDA08097.1 BZ3501_MvSof-1269-A2-R1_Chr8-1g09534 [Microbotryum saponariae]
MSTSTGNYPSVLLPADRAAFAAVVAPSPSHSPSSPGSTTADSTTASKQEWPPVYAHPASQSQSQQSQSQSQSQAGTMDNPLIPKRRRRTSPDELRILEAEFQANPLPSQAQRAALSARLGMTGRALQVWFQNRRQKEKKDAGAYLGTSGDSSEGSATDQDRDAADLEGLSFAMSSSPPRPSPTEPHRHHTQVRGHARGGSYLDAKALESLPSSEQIYRRPDADKENQAVPTATSSSSDSASISLATTATRGLPSVLNNASGSSFHTWHISAASTAPIRHTFTIPAAVSSGVTPPLPVYVVKPTTNESRDQFQHRSSTTSVIAAKKHVKRRPLGSHAPTARKPSLPHSFNFPSSPDTATTASSSAAMSKDGRLKAPTLRRTVSNVSINSNTSESFSLQTSECGRASAVWLESQQTQRVESPTSSTFPASSAPTATPSVLRGFKSHDKEVWRLMQSDAPSSPNQSPAPLTRKMMLAHAQAQAQSAENETESSRHMMLSSEDAPSFDIDAMYDDQPALATAASINARSSRRPNPIRAISLGGTSTSQTSRAGGEEACAVSALERKRQRVLETSYSAVPTAPAATKPSRRGSSGGRSTTSRSSSAGAPCRSNSHNGPRRANSSEKTHTAARKMLRIDTGSSSAHDAKSFVSPREALSSPQESVDENDHEDGSSSMGDLSYSSTCTTSTTSGLGTPKLEAESYFALGGKGAASMVKKDCSNDMVDQERECAELLLGLGGGGIFC